MSAEAAAALCPPAAEGTPSSSLVSEWLNLIRAEYNEIPGLNLTRHQLDTVHIHPDSISRTLTKAALPAKMRIAADCPRLGLSKLNRNVPFIT
jgi:hypothetical protein